VRRPHRSIETFDISLMAVVTKAMGAFLVLMLLLMPYYSSSPMGQQTADDLATKVDQVKKNVQTVRDQLTGASNEDLRRLLEEALAQLDEARKLINELKRMNDALNAQVHRLEDENAALKGQVAQLQGQIAQLQGQVARLQGQVAAQNTQIAALSAEVEKLRQENADLKERLNRLNGAMIAVQLVNWDCPDLALSIGVWTRDSSFGYKGEKHYDVLDYVFSTIGSGGWRSDADIREKIASQRDVAPGHDLRFNSSYVIYPGATAQNYALVVSGRAETRETAADGHPIVALKKAATDCTFLVSVQVKLRGKDDVISFPARERKLEKNNYAVLLGDLVLKDDDADWFRVSDPKNVAWFLDQLEHAKKE
jgi:hypothetical protein